VKGPNAAHLRVAETRFAGRGPQSREEVSCEGEAYTHHSSSDRPKDYKDAERCGRGRPNGLSLSCTARAHMPKPTRRDGCRD